MNILVKIVCALCLVGIGHFGKITYNKTQQEEVIICQVEGDLAEEIFLAVHRGTEDGAVSYKEGSSIHLFCHGSVYGTLLVNGKWMHRDEIYFYLQDQIDSETKSIVLHCCHPGVKPPIYMMGITIKGDCDSKDVTYNILKTSILGKKTLVHTR